MNPFAQWGVMFPLVQRFTPHLSTRTTPNLLDLGKFPKVKKGQRSKRVKGQRSKGGQFRDHCRFIRPGKLHCKGVWKLQCDDIAPRPGRRPPNMPPPDHHRETGFPGRLLRICTVD
jgi:hypothetical protein